MVLEGTLLLNEKCEYIVDTEEKGGINLSNILDEFLYVKSTKIEDKIALHINIISNGNKLFDRVGKISRLPIYIKKRQRDKAGKSNVWGYCMEGKDFDNSILWKLVDENVKITVEEIDNEGDDIGDITK